MQHSIIPTFIILLFICFSCVNNSPIEKNQPDSFPETEKQKPVFNEILVRFKPDTDPEIIKAIQHDLGLETVRIMSVPDLYRMKVTGELPVEDVIEKLLDYSEVLYAEPDHKYKI